MADYLGKPLQLGRNGQKYVYYRIHIIYIVTNSRILSLLIIVINYNIMEAFILFPTLVKHDVVQQSNTSGHQLTTY